MILVATGLRREARLVAGPGVLPVAGGGVAQALEAALTAAAPRASAVMSFGLAGGLAPALRPGDCLVSRSLATDDGDLPVDQAWAAALLAQLPAARGERLFASGAMLLTAQGKAAARARSGATAADMESHVAARVAQRFGLPFVALRAVSDAAGQDLPAAVAVGMTPDGGMALWPVLAALARRPGDLPGLIRAGRGAERAFRSLVDARHLLGPGLGFADLGELVLDVG